jgi:hypothetical protein
MTARCANGMLSTKSVGRPNQAMRLEILELTEQTLTLNLRGIEARALR